MKSLFITYLLWLFGGFVGLHHFYLGRDYHALIWWMFCGGYFGIGWFRDLWRIPEYVKDANEDPKYMEKLAEKMRNEPQPTTGTVRYFGIMLVSDAFGYLVVNAIPGDLMPENYCNHLHAVIVPFATALGTYLVGNIGRHEGTFKPILLGAYLSFPAYFITKTPVSLSATLSCIAYNLYSKRWRRTPRPRRSLCKRIASFAFCLIIYCSLCCSWLYFNCHLVYQDQEEIKCRDAAKHFFKSPIWKEFVRVMEDLWNVANVHGLGEMWNKIVEAFDPVGESNALKVLGLNPTASQQEITTRYRKLSRDWHPDKHKDPIEKEIAQEKFIEIQQAYEILSDIKSQRVTKNIKDPTKNGTMKEDLEQTNMFLFK